MGILDKQFFEQGQMVLWDHGVAFPTCRFVEAAREKKRNLVSDSLANHGNQSRWFPFTNSYESFNFLSFILQYSGCFVYIFLRNFYAGNWRAGDQNWSLRESPTFYCCVVTVSSLSLENMRRSHRQGFHEDDFRFHNRNVISCCW